MTDSDTDPAVAALLALPEREFVDECYRRLLLREPDPGGAAHQVERVRRGDDRLAIAADMSASKEARGIIRDRRSLAANVLAQHGKRLVERARTPGRRKAAAARVAQYIAHVGGIERASSQQVREQDPFADYYNSVITDRD
jgi:hypothetical protein